MRSVFKLEVINLSLIKNNKHIISNINFNVFSGNTLLLTGPNGSGKSSLLKMLAGLIEPTSGHVLYSNVTGIHKSFCNNDIHYIGNNDPIYDDLTVYDNISYWMYLYGSDQLKGLNLYQKRKHILNMFALQHLSDLPSKYLSLGQRKRLSLSRLLLKEKSVWLLDEPTVGLDKESVLFLSYLINAHRNMGGITIIASHLNIRLFHALQLSLPL